jgi:dihydrolipoamide dehydrogenase
VEQSFDFIVIGGGPGGYVAAIKGAQLGFKVACVDGRGVLGGVCLNEGCIPSKALLHSSHLYEKIHHLSDHGIGCSGVTLDLHQMMARKNKIVSDLNKGISFLFKKNNITFFSGYASFESPHTLRVQRSKNGAVDQNQEDILLTAPHIAIATGSTPVSLPGVTIDEKVILSSSGALEIDQVPENMVVIGGGYIGLELGSLWRRLGSKVTVLEYAPHILPQMDQEIAHGLHRILTQQGMDIQTNTKVLKVDIHEKGTHVYVSNSEGDHVIDCNIVLSCTGRKPNTQGLNLEKIGLSLDDHGRIPVSDSFETSVKGVYAIGDVIRGPMLAHKAEEEGIALAEYLAHQKPHIDYQKIPSVIYTSPEAATVGQSEEELKNKNLPYKVGRFPFSANSRAKATGQTEGFVKILTHSETDEILGVHILHEDAGHLIAEGVLAMEYRASAEDLARTCHAHPTLSEALKEAAYGAYFRTIHG